MKPILLLIVFTFLTVKADEAYIRKRFHENPTYMFALVLAVGSCRAVEGFDTADEAAKESYALLRKYLTKNQVKNLYLNAQMLRTKIIESSGGCFMFPKSVDGLELINPTLLLKD